ncbi:MAG: TlpA disulfide reductase family protein [Nocardioidaceae bacterium]
MRRPLRRTTTLLAAVLVSGAALAGCSNDIGASGAQGFVSGNGTIHTLPAADRRTPGAVEGKSLEGKPLSLADYKGKVVVVNVWGSWCGPCRSEAPMLAAAARDLASKDVVFLGINSRNPETASPLAFVRRFHIPYDSIWDPDGRTLLAFRGTLPANAIPSTVVIDKRGRVAASVLGEVTRTTLYDLVDEARS